MNYGRKRDLAFKLKNLYAKLVQRYNKIDEEITTLEHKQILEPMSSCKTKYNNNFGRSTPLIIPTLILPKLLNKPK